MLALRLLFSNLQPKPHRGADCEEYMENEMIENSAEVASKRPKQIEVTVNGRAVQLPKGDLTGIEIKQAAIAQGVPIELDFILQLELPNGNSRIIGDQDPVKIRPHERFTAIANDDNS
jgi:Multiubiquitin